MLPQVCFDVRRRIWRVRHSMQLNQLLQMSSGSVHELPFAQEKLKVVDMQREMVEQAFRVAQQALASHEIERQIAKHIKQHFDTKYYPNWHCLVGKSFATVVTYESRHYIHFQAGDKSIVLFKFG